MIPSPTEERLSAFALHTGTYDRRSLISPIVPSIFTEGQQGSYLNSTLPIHPRRPISHVVSVKRHTRRPPKLYFFRALFSLNSVLSRAISTCTPPHRTPAGPDPFCSVCITRTRSYRRPSIGFCYPSIILTLLRLS